MISEISAQTLSQFLLVFWYLYQDLKLHLRGLVTMNMTWNQEDGQVSPPSTCHMAEQIPLWLCQTEMSQGWGWYGQHVPYLRNHPITLGYPITHSSEVWLFLNHSMLGALKKHTLSAGPWDGFVLTSAVKDDCMQIQNNRGCHFIGCPQGVHHTRRWRLQEQHKATPHRTTGQRLDGTGQDRPQQPSAAQMRPSHTEPSWHKQPPMALSIGLHPLGRLPTKQHLKIHKN